MAEHMTARLQPPLDPTVADPQVVLGPPANEKTMKVKENNNVANKL